MITHIMRRIPINHAHAFIAFFDNLHQILPKDATRVVRTQEVNMRGLGPGQDYQPPQRACLCTPTSSPMLWLFNDALFTRPVGELFLVL